MYLMYVDESGDCGLTNSPSKYFVLSAIVIHELRWRTVIKSLAEFKRELKKLKGIKIREEIHCHELISNPGKLARIKRHERLDIIKRSINWIGAQTDINVMSVVVNKEGKQSDVFEMGWNTLLMRFENTINYKNFNGGRQDKSDDVGMVIADNTDVHKLRLLQRKMRHINFTPSKFGTTDRDLRIKFIIEDPVFRDSQDSLLHQMTDVLAYSLKQKYAPNSYMKSKAATDLYSRLPNVVKKISRLNNGIVEI